MAAREFYLCFDFKILLLYSWCESGFVIPGTYILDWAMHLHIAHAKYPWTEYMIPRIKYVLLIEETLLTEGKFIEFDSIVPRTSFCIKIDNWQNANLLTTNFARLDPILQK
jgi:hypothetical protein